MKISYKDILNFTNKHDDLIRHYKKKDKLIKYFRKIYNLTSKEVNIFFILFDDYIKSESAIDTKSIREKYKLSLDEYVNFMNTIRTLISKGMVKKEKVFIDENTDFTPRLSIDNDILETLIFKKKIENRFQYDNPFFIANHISDLIHSRKQNEFSMEELYDKINNILSKADKKLKSFHAIRKYNDEEKVVLFTIIDGYFNGTLRFSNIQNISELVYDNQAKMAELIKKMLNKNLDIIKDKYIELDYSLFYDNPTVKFSQTGAYRLFGIKSSYKNSKLNLEVSTHIKYKKAQKNSLYFPKNFDIMIKRLKKAIEPNHFNELIKKLKSSKYNESFSLLFYGFPGTGKTATVYEMANKSKRDILQVDIEKIRDKYVGESEKKLSLVFEEYRIAKKKLKHTPILLFNEADALISKRINISNSVDQMNNAMQNILLQNLENFKGIFIATTNLSDNLDNAFSRRFLYKLKFPKPDDKTREIIWQNKLPNLSKKTCEIVSRYNLTGGQIELIAKQYTILSILENKEFSKDTLIDMIEKEISYGTKKSAKIGF